MRLRYNASITIEPVDVAIPAVEDLAMTISIADREPGKAALLGRRAVLRGGLAGGLGLAALAAEAAFHGVDAKPKSKKPVTTTNSSGSNGSSQGGNATGSGTTGGNSSGNSTTGNSSTGSNGPSGTDSTGASQTGTSVSHDTVGTSQTVPPTQGTSVTGSSVHCTTVGEVVDANNPANNRPATTVCTTS